jgi:hypothetical protein
MQSDLDVTDDSKALINWATVTTNVTGLVLGAAVLGMFGGVGYMVFKLPPTLEQILSNQEVIKGEYVRLNRRVDDIEKRLYHGPTK